MKFNLGFQAIDHKLKLMTNKKQFFDIFQKSIVDGKFMFEQQATETIIKLKIRKREK